MSYSESEIDRYKNLLLVSANLGLDNRLKMDNLIAYHDNYLYYTEFGRIYENYIGTIGNIIPTDLNIVFSNQKVKSYLYKNYSYRCGVNSEIKIIDNLKFNMIYMLGDKEISVLLYSPTMDFYWVRNIHKDFFEETFIPDHTQSNLNLIDEI